MDLNLEGKVAIVTGAARGIGRTTALTLCKEGANVVIDDIDLEAAKLVEEEAKALGVQAVAIMADVTNLDEVRQMVKETLGRFGRIDILVNNAGILYIKGKSSAAHKLFEQTTEDDWRREIDITLFSALDCSKAVLEPMLSQKSGSIINIASRAATAPGLGRTAYGAGKGGVIALTRNLAVELGPSGIRVNCVSPGIIKTTRGEEIESGLETRPELLKSWEDIQASAKRAPLGRIGMPQEVANVVAFLASDACSYVTGQTLNVNGGIFMA